MLAATEDQHSTALLAERAIFDPAAQVRKAAVHILQTRSPEEYRGILLKGLRYPWAPVADHAAEALVKLEDREALPQVAELLDQPDPCLPFLDKEKKARRGAIGRCQPFAQLSLVSCTVNF